METNRQIQTVAPTTDIETIDANVASKKLASMMAFIKQNLKKGTDYMSIAGGKPTLLKSGAEKMNILMGFGAEYEKTKEIMNKDDQTYYVEIKCTLRHLKSGVAIAQAIGSCNNKEKARQHLAFYDSLNPVLKIAEKRAYVAATLNANALSQFYSQDLDDEVTQNRINAAK